MNIPWGAIATLAIYIIGSTIGFVWWMSRITVTLEFMSKGLDSMSKNMSSMDALYVRKEDIIRELALHEKRLDTLWTKMDNLKNKEII